MFYSWDINITADTKEKTPKTQVLKISKGVITKAVVKFPAGCHSMVHVKIFKGEWQIIPVNRDDWVTGDNERVETEEYYEIAEEPFQLKFYGHSEGTTYDHNITIRLTILPKEVATFLPLIQLLAQFFKRIGLIE